MGAWKKLQPPPIPPHISGKTWVFSKLSHKNDAVCQDRACTIIGIQLVWKAASLELQPKPGCRLRALPPVQNSQGSERSKQVICSNSQRSRGTGHKTWHANPSNPLFRFQSFGLEYARSVEKSFLRRTWFKGTDPLLWHYPT